MVKSTTPQILEKLEAYYGKQEPCWPTDPYRFLVWWQCGYPASDAACSRGWESLNSSIGIHPDRILAASIEELAKALTPGGMVPAVRAKRLKEIATRVRDEYGGDLRRGLLGSLPEVRRALKKFPNIADPGADRILLFSGVAPAAAVPSNCPHVLVRIQRGLERESYGANYQVAQHEIAGEVAENIDARTRAYLLLKQHGQELCKRTRPKCDACPVNSCCAYYAANRRDRGSV